MRNRLLPVVGFLALFIMAGGLMLWLIPQGEARRATEVPTPPPRTFEEQYATQGQTARLVAPPYTPERLAYYHQIRPDQVSELPNGPDAMLVFWNDGKPRIQTASWGAGDPERGGFRLDTLVEQLLGFRGMDIDAVDGVKYLQFHGDIVFDADTSFEQRRLALEKLARAAGMEIAIKEVEAERPLMVLKGEWHYRPADGSPWTGTETAPVLEIYGATLDVPLAGRRAFAEGDAGGLGGVLSYHISKDVTIRATGMPSRMKWFYNYHGDGTPESLAAARNADLVLRHLCEQTGLTLAEERHTIRRLAITQVSGPRLP